METKKSNNNSNINNTSDFKSRESVEDVMKDLEEKINPKTYKEGIIKLGVAVQSDDPTILIKPIQAGVDEFKARTGRNMTYSEMREMWG
jgi:hypothetical protein